MSVSNILLKRMDIHENYRIGRISHLELWLCHQIKPFPAFLALFSAIHGSPVDSPKISRWRGALIFSLTCVLNKRLSKQLRHRGGGGGGGGCRRHCAHYDVTVMIMWNIFGMLQLTPWIQYLFFYVLEPCLFEIERKTCERTFITFSGHDEHDIRYNRLNCFTPDLTVSRSPN